ncbi:MAG: DUF4397 domain-containing protein [Cyclobacteriaceae bacterium]|nr:DUF4397 domain-containing protein [Cyclobacteriaceae bacterium]
MRLSKSILAGLALATSAVLTSCLGDLESPTLPPTAYVSIYQGSPDAPALDIFANANKVNREPMQFSQVLAYNAFYPGNRDFRFSPYNSATSLLEKDFKLAADSVYSLFVVNESTQLDAILVKDEWEEPSADKSQLRLIHLSPDTEAVHLKINNAATPIVSNAAYKSNSDFIEITPGKSTLTISLAGSGETLLTSGSLDLKGNRVYTLVLRGLKSQASGDKKLDIQLITNYFSF